MAEVRVRTWRRNKLPPLTCSPEETRKNEVPLETENAEKILDTDSVSSDESVSILSQSQVSFPTQLKRENALHVFPANLENDTLVASSPRKNVSGYYSAV